MDKMKAATIAVLASLVSSAIAYSAGDTLGRIDGYGRGLNDGINRAMDMMAEEKRKLAAMPIAPDHMEVSAVYYTGNGGDYQSGCSTEAPLSLPPCPPGKTCKFDADTGQVRVSPDN